VIQSTGEKKGFCLASDLGGKALSFLPLNLKLFVAFYRNSASY
jgi:hypothetical protein